MRKFFIFLFVLLLFCGCGSKSRLDKIMSENNYIIVDVRTSVEFNSGHVVGAINIPYDKIDGSNLDKSKTIIVYCQSGKRSGVAYDVLKNMGYDVYDLGAYDSITLEKV